GLSSFGMRIVLSALSSFSSTSSGSTSYRPFAFSHSVNTWRLITTVKPSIVRSSYPGTTSVFALDLGEPALEFVGGSSANRKPAKELIRILLDQRRTSAPLFETQLHYYRECRVVPSVG